MASTSPARRPREPRAVVRGRNIHLNVMLLANRSSGEIEEICRSADLTHAQYVALFVLCLSPDGAEGLPIGSVADGLLTRSSDTTRLVDRLERAGLAERIPNPSDRRGVLVRATDKGRAAFAEVTPAVQALHRRQWQHLDADELDQLEVLLLKALWGEDLGASRLVDRK